MVYYLVIKKSSVICKTIDGTRMHHANWNKLNRKRQVLLFGCKKSPQR